MTNIAIAEDHREMRNSISLLIKNLPNHTVSIEAANGYQLIEQISCLKKLPSVAIMDVQMPVMDGVSVTDFLTCHYPYIKILALSNHSHPAIVQDMLYAGASGYIVKDNLSNRLLLNAFTTICSGGVFIDETLGNKEIFLTTRTQTIRLKTSHPDITEKEKTFLQLSATSISYEQIAKLMNVAKESVYNYQKSLKEKLGLGSRQEFILYAIQHGIAKVARYNNYTPSRLR